jgi:hypothetical protein
VTSAAGWRSSRRYFAFAPLAGGSCIILSLVGLRGRLIGMLSGLLEPPEPEADSGGFTIDALLSCGAVFAVCASAAAPLVAASASASAMLSARVVRLLRFIGSSCAIPLLILLRLPMS